MPYKDWKQYRAKQQERRQQRLPQRRKEVLNLRHLGYQVKALVTDHPNGDHFHVLGVGGGLTFFPLHRNYATHGSNPIFGTYMRPSDVLVEHGIKPFPKQEKKNEKQEIIPQPAAEVRGFKPARSYWSWRKHFGAGVDDGQRPADSGAPADQQSPDQHPAAAAAECVAGSGQCPEAPVDPAGSAQARAGVGGSR